jgi:hypothetical protein
MAVRRTLAGSVAALLLPALLTGCGGDSSVADPPVESSPTSSSPTGEPATHETAEHFIRRWAEAEKQMENTGETEGYLSLGTHCSSCRELASDVEEFYSAGGYVQWGGWQIISIKPYPTGGRHQAFAMRARSAPTTYKKSASSPRQLISGGLATDLITLQRTPRSWSVVAFTKLGS